MSGSWWSKAGGLHQLRINATWKVILVHHRRNLLPSFRRPPRAVPQNDGIPAISLRYGPHGETPGSFLPDN
ncbi:hypothetical protein V2G26_005257 [Clonostachys chloroleuca]